MCGGIDAHPVAFANPKLEETKSHRIDALIELGIAQSKAATLSGLMNRRWRLGSADQGRLVMIGWQDVFRPMDW